MQKSALRCILGESYNSYEDALKKLGLVTLVERREQMCLKFAKECLKLDKMKMLFPRNESSHSILKRNPEFYKVVSAQTRLLSWHSPSSQTELEKFLRICAAMKCPQKIFFTYCHVSNIWQNFWTSMLVSKFEQIPLKIRFNSQVLLISSEIFAILWRKHDFHPNIC